MSYLRPPMLLPPPPKLPPPPPKLLPLPLLLPLPKEERVVVERVEGVVRVEEFLCELPELLRRVLPELLRRVLPELLRRVLVFGVNVLSRDMLPRCTLPRVVVPLCPKLREGR